VGGIAHYNNSLYHDNNIKYNSSREDTFLYNDKLSCNEFPPDKLTMNFHPMMSLHAAVIFQATAIIQVIENLDMMFSVYYSINIIINLVINVANLSL